MWCCMAIINMQRGASTSGRGLVVQASCMCRQYGHAVWCCMVSVAGAASIDSHTVITVVTSTPNLLCAYFHFGVPMEQIR